MARARFGPSAGIARQRDSRQCVAMSTSLYAAAVPTFQRYLGQLAGLLDHAETHCATSGRSQADLLQCRLAPDMAPFSKQVEIAANFSFRICYPLAGRDIPPYGEVPADLASLRAHIARSQDLLAALLPADFEVEEERVIAAEAGEARFNIAAGDYLLQYGLPNHLFHLAMAYAILRQQGVPVGKRDYDGWHRYTR